MDGEPEIMQEEARRGVKRVKMRKAAGICGIMPQMLRTGGEVVVVADRSLASGDWKNAVLYPYI